jgi:hypothetical protein
MKTEKDLNADILKITTLIHEKYPELSKYIEEMPITIPNKANPSINLRVLQDYYDSLYSMFKKYARNHTNIKQNNAFFLMNFYSNYVL